MTNEQKSAVIAVGKESLKAFVAVNPGMKPLLAAGDAIAIMIADMMVAREGQVAEVSSGGDA